MSNKVQRDCLPQVMQSSLKADNALELISKTVDLLFPKPHLHSVCRLVSRNARQSSQKKHSISYLDQQTCPGSFRGFKTSSKSPSARSSSKKTCGASRSIIQCWRDRQTARLILTSFLLSARLFTRMPLTCVASLAAMKVSGVCHLAGV